MPPVHAHERKARCQVTLSMQNKHTTSLAMLSTSGCYPSHYG